MQVGQRVNIGYNALAAGVATTATVAVTVTDPSGNTTTPAVTFTAPNLYDSSFTLTAAGVWYWEWTVSGAVVDDQGGQVTALDPAPPTYASLALLKQSLGLASTDVTKDDMLNLALAGASRSVEQYCDGRVFTLDATATARTFSLGRWVVCTDQGERRDVNDIGATGGLVVEVGDGTTWTTVTTVETYPDNALARGQAITAVVSPYQSLRCHRRLRVTARWGWPQVPTAVEQATLLQAARLYQRKDSPQGVAGSAEWGLVRVPNLDPDVKALLAYLTSYKVA
jgi:hypothetical protein